MSSSSVAHENRPVANTVKKVDDDFAVGSDIEFQQRWGRLERIIWPALIGFLLLSLAGVFGRGPVANAMRTATDGSMTVRYERIQRFGTPSVLTVDLNQTAIQNGMVHIWLSDDLVKPLGNQRVIPAPVESKIGDRGIFYSFAASRSPASIEFQTQPSALGLSELKLKLSGHPLMSLKIFVMP